MAKTISFIGFLLVAAVFNSNAQNNDRTDQRDSVRIVQLEKEIQELKLRITKLESLLNNPSKAQQPATSSDGWKSIVNWRKLTKDMNISDAQTILGAPNRVEGGDFTIWYYQNNGRVIFYEGKVYEWSEPLNRLGDK